MGRDTLLISGGEATIVRTGTLNKSDYFALVLHFVREVLSSKSSVIPKVVAGKEDDVPIVRGSLTVQEVGLRTLLSLHLFSVPVEYFQYVGTPRVNFPPDIHR